MVGEGRMKVLFLNRVYPPADGATGKLLAELAQELFQRGWEVTVVTSRTSADLPRSEMVAGVQVERVNTLRFTRASHWRRALSYLTVYPALLGRALRLPRADVVVTMTDPPLLVLLGPIVKCTKASRLVHWAQDLYPEVAEELGVLPKGGVLAKLCTGLSTWAARRHDRIIAVGRCMKQRLLGRGLPQESTHVVPNWAGAGTPMEDTANPFRLEHGLKGRFVVMYSGNLGLAHPFEAILEAAAQLRATNPEIVFVMVGGGPRLESVKRAATERSLDNVRFLPPQPAERLAQSLGAADLHLVSMRDELCGLVVPSKIYGVLAAGRPCVFLGPKESEAARILEEFQCGAVINPADGTALSRCLSEWASDVERVREAGQRAREASAHFNPRRAAQAFHEILLQAARTETGLALQQSASRTQT